MIPDGHNYQTTSLGIHASSVSSIEPWLSKAPLTIPLHELPETGCRGGVDALNQMDSKMMRQAELSLQENQVCDNMQDKGIEYFRRIKARVLVVCGIMTIGQEVHGLLVRVEWN
ncbi:hypothetical protein VN97_g7103 [Penicillium thymicola]|uniref:Uncharacterized protein n=1 Tax=Penicillium thymicola TaxID=293382 RepID=A0AAI9TFQ5_PENTH|nr:hypothetical protein VN97_g7103 [Penicillium thymicola]